MCEVTRRNFEEILFSFHQNVKSASFISIDCEFSGIFDDIKCTLFDSPEARFKKLQESLANFSIIQFGLSTFKYENFCNTYTVSTYNFYLKPPAGLRTHHTLSFHPGSAQFLCKNNFDFNKLFYDGINYVGLRYEDIIWRKIKLNKIEEIINKDDYAEKIEKYCSEVSRWLGSAKDSEMFLKLSDEDSTCVCLLHQEIRKRFPNVWTYFEEGKVVKIRKISSLERSQLSDHTGEREILETEIFNSVIGFSRVIRIITELRIPVVGHNVLLDLIMIYKQFYNPWPVSYEIFKRAVSYIFPIVFDTKHISFTLRQFLSKRNTWNSNSLSDLYNYLKHGKGGTLVIFSPLINHTNENFIKKTYFHNAGFDSYCTGYCFLKLAHILSLKDADRKDCFQLTMMQPTNTWLLAAVAPMMNKVNMSRGQVDYIVLDGKDPRSSRPGLLYIESKTSFPLDISKVSEMIAKYASVDIRPLTKYKALMAVSSRNQAQDILERFKCDKEVKVTKYSFLKHSAPGKVLKAALVASVILTVAYLTRSYLEVEGCNVLGNTDCVMFARRFL